jgi:hypothetical protein
MTSYRKRENVFEKGEREWRVDPHALVLRTVEGAEMAYPWRDVTTVRLRHNPSRFNLQRHAFDVAFKNGIDWSIDNGHYAGFATFEDRTATYTPFVRAALARIAAEAPNAKVYMGSSLASYLAQVALVTVAFLALVAVFLTLPVFESSDPWWIGLKLVLIAAMLPPFIIWVRTNYPRAIKIDAIPDDAWPRA